jgi:hypothetical protein
MGIGHVLKVGAFLDKLLVAAMFAGEFVILNMLGLYMIVHSILLGRSFGAELAMEDPVIITNIHRFSGGGRHDSKEGKNLGKT